MGGFRSFLAFWIGGASSYNPGPPVVITIDVALIPEGGCANDPSTSIIYGVPNSAASLVGAPVSQALQIGVPVTAQIQFGQRRRKPLSNADQ